MTNSHNNAHTNLLFYINNILPFEKLIPQNKLLFMHSIAYDYAPPSFNNTWIKKCPKRYWLCPAQPDFFILPKVRIESFCKNPIYALPLEWHILDEHIRYQHNRTTFKIPLFDYLLGTLLDP
jgi:hypothetical protein